jgi:hypothetical protein
MQSSPASRHFLPLRPKYSLQTLNSCSSLAQDAILHTHTKQHVNYFFVYLIFKFFYYTNIKFKIIHCLRYT